MVRHLPLRGCWAGRSLALARMKVPIYWIAARRPHHLSHAQIQMARDLGVDPAKLGELDNHRQEAWKLPLPQFIEEIYFKRFGKRAPDIVMSIEGRIRLEQERKEARRAARQQRATETA